MVYGILDPGVESVSLVLVLAFSAWHIKTRFALIISLHSSVLCRPAKPRAI